VQSPADRLKYLRTEYARAKALYSEDHPDVQRLKREMEGLEAATTLDADIAKSEANDDRRQLDDAKTQLASARQRYSTDHPDVLRLERLVASLESRVPAHAPERAADSGTSPDEPTDRPVRASADNPPYIQIQSQREAAVTQIRALHKKRNELQATLAGLEKHLAETPAVERDYNAMLRDLDSAQIEYRQVRQKQMEAETAQNLETERKGERFTLIEPPFTPEEPTSPNPPVSAPSRSSRAPTRACAAATTCTRSSHRRRSRPFRSCSRRSIARAHVATACTRWPEESRACW
jgi:uncharacterized protein involved in exopolysaccharide biosynthesis